MARILAIQKAMIIVQGRRLLKTKAGSEVVPLLLRQERGDEGDL